MNDHGIPAVALSSDNLADPALLEVRLRALFWSCVQDAETINSAHFAKKVTSNAKFKKSILAVCYDEGHTILEWGGSFRTDYKKACETLRGRLPSGTQILLKMTDRTALIEFSNARPNIAISIRRIETPEDSYGDLLGVLPDDVL